MTMYIYRCIIVVHTFNFLKTLKHDFNWVFMNCIEDEICIGYFVEKRGNNNKKIIGFGPHGSEDGLCMGQ